MDVKRPNRRGFLKSGAALAGGLTLGAVEPASAQMPAAPTMLSARAHPRKKTENAARNTSPRTVRDARTESVRERSVSAVASGCGIVVAKSAS